MTAYGTSLMLFYSLHIDWDIQDYKYMHFSELLDISSRRYIITVPALP
jgi:hypothetical protein